jgi:RHS repeat-associated protein
MDMTCASSCTTSTILFTGKERGDPGSENSLDYFIARYYAGAQGRFTSPDPEGAGATAAEPQSWNMYAYGNDNPLRFVDPGGRCSRDKTGGYCGVSVTGYVSPKLRVARMSFGNT